MTVLRHSGIFLLQVDCSVCVALVFFSRKKSSDLLIFRYYFVTLYPEIEKTTLIAIIINAEFL